MKDIVQPIFPSEIFDWNFEKLIATSTIGKIWEYVKSVPENKNKRPVLDVDYLMWIKSSETGLIITCKMEEPMGKKPTSYWYKVTNANNPKMFDWTIIINLVDMPDEDP